MGVDLGVDFTRLRVAVRDAAERAFTEVRASHPDEHFYAFALYTDDGAMTIMPAANTEEEFRRNAGPDAEEEDYSRWATGEWGYEAVGHEAFQKAYDLLNADNRDEEEKEEGREKERGKEEDDDTGFVAFRLRVIEAMISGLGDLDAQGFFGSGPARERVTLFVSISDSDESEAVEDASARRLNPAPVYERFVRRYE